MTNQTNKKERKSRLKALKFPPVLFTLAILLSFLVVNAYDYFSSNPFLFAQSGGGQQEFTLRTYLNGYVGVGGNIDGKTNPALKANVGDTVKVNIVNGENLMHDFAVEELGVKTSHVMRKDEAASVTFKVSTDGTYNYYCTVPGHRAAGMEGQLIVGRGSGRQPEPAKPVGVSYISRNASDLPPPLNRGYSTTVHITLEAIEVIAEIEPGTTYDFWTFNGTVPGPFIRVRVNDTVVVHFRNAANSTMSHSVDFHAVTGPGGGAKATQTPPGQETMFTFKALNPGVYVYHCASPHIPTHLAFGLYGLILVEPENGLPPVDREFYVMQGDFYTVWPVGTQGHQEFDSQKLNDEEPTYVVFNGRWRGLTGNYVMKANVGETVRIFFGVGGPNVISSFHVIGEIFDRVYPEGDLVSSPLQSVQTTLVPAGGSTVVEFVLQVPADYILVDHSLTRTIDKGALAILTAYGASDPDVYNVESTSSGGH